MPTLYEVNTRVVLNKLSHDLARAATLDDLPDTMLEEWKDAGFHIVWLLGVWQTGEAGRQVSLNNPEWLAEYATILPGFRLEDVCGSCFAIQDYRVHDSFGGNEALQRLRERLRSRGLSLMLDFVCNHVALDHPWADAFPERFVRGTEEDLAREPHNYCRRAGEVFAYGRDPYFAGWPDTLQLDYSNPETQLAMQDVLDRIASLCDGLRCDMAMLVLPEVFERTWGRAAKPFWPEATARIHASHPGFLFLAEVYWDLEYALQRQGFDFTYDKRLYDRLRDRSAAPVLGHLRADLDFQEKLARFLENHDEPRAAETFAGAIHCAAAMITYNIPGLRFFHQGQLEGFQRRIPVHLCRGPIEQPHPEIAQFYARLIECLQRPGLAAGAWALLEPLAAWHDNPTHASYVCFERTAGFERYLIVVNFSPVRSQCYVRLAQTEAAVDNLNFTDLMGEDSFLRPSAECAARGLYLDLEPWAYHLFAVTGVN